MTTEPAADAVRQASERLAGAFLARFRHRPLAMLPDGGVLRHPGGFIPRLVAWTEEDKAAKGLRSLRDRAAEPAPPIRFSALEMAQEARCLVLTAPAGGGKTALAVDVGLHLAGEVVGDAMFRHEGLARMPPRNEHGDGRSESWRLGSTVPAYLEAMPGASWGDHLDAAGADLATLLAATGASEALIAPLLVVDGAERLGRGGEAFLRAARAAVADHPRLRVMVLGDTDVVNSWEIPEDVPRHELLPLLVAQRRLFWETRLAPAGPASASAAHSTAAAHPGLFALALRLMVPAVTAEDIVDAWQAVATVDDPLRAQRFVADLLAARELASEPPARAVALFRADPAGTAPVISSLAARLAREPARLALLVGALIEPPDDSGLRGALLVADALEAESPWRGPVLAALSRLVEQGRLTAAERARAANILAVRGDARDLEAMVSVPGGAFVLGSASHPNSDPPHVVAVSPFRIGVFPVTNARYAAFVADTGRPWHSREGKRPERAGHPAVDLTWHDARAFCAWLTARWRAEGRIGPGDIARLPTEPEWERAARGDQPDAGAAIVYPWGATWDPECANAAATGFNDTCAVGLFPKGRSPHGCLDMAGQVWEWTTTLWGEDMATPRFAYPYRDDGREDTTAPDAVRRVLRGGCFSSGPAKASCTYRGSLEANGFWRGNGFRLVVAAA